MDRLRETRPRKVKDPDLKALLDKNDTHSQIKLAYQFGVTKAVISIRLQAMKKMQKVGE